MNRSIMFSIVFTMILVLACASPPKQYMYENSIKINSDFDKTWEAVISYFASSNVPIKTLEKESGIIAAETQAFPEEWVDCGSAGFGVKFLPPAIGTFNVFVKRESGGGSFVQVTASFSIEKYDTFNNRPMGHVNCNSTGYFEESLLEYVNLHIK